MVFTLWESTIAADASGSLPTLFLSAGTEGCRAGGTLGTSWHGVLESDAFRRALLRWVAAERNLDWSPGDEPFAAAREAQLDKLGDLVAENVDREALLRTMEAGAPAGLPVLSLQLSGLSAQQTAGGDRARVGSPRKNGQAPTAGPGAFVATGVDHGRSEG